MTTDQSPHPTPFLELVAKATKGPWTENNIIGRVVVPDAIGGFPNWKDAQLIARIATPEVARRIYETLEKCAKMKKRHLFPPEPTAEAFACQEVLELLDGHPTNTQAEEGK